MQQTNRTCGKLSECQSSRSIAIKEAASPPRFRFTKAFCSVVGRTRFGPDACTGDTSVVGRIGIACAKESGWVTGDAGITSNDDGQSPGREPSKLHSSNHTFFKDALLLKSGIRPVKLALLPVLPPKAELQASLACVDADAFPVLPPRAELQSSLARTAWPILHA